jgi:hypothetical protein
MPVSRFPYARPALAALLILSAVGLAACGGGSGSAATTAATTTATPTTTGAAAAGGGGANGAAFTKFTACLKQHGVTLPTGRGGFGGGNPPTGTNGGNGTPPPTGTTGTTRRRGGGGFFGGANANPKTRAALTACQKLLPAGRFGGGGFGRGGAGGGQNSAAFAAYTNCLKLHGVTLARGGFGRPGANGNRPKPTAKMTAALKACAALRPTFQRPGGGTSTTPTATTTQ